MGSRRIARIYRERGDSENRIEDLENDLVLDRTSCSRFLANQLGVLLTASAFVLFQHLRLRTARRFDGRPTAGSLSLLEIAARVERSARCVVLRFSASQVSTIQRLKRARARGASPS